jgi:hypothetical protein
MSTALKVVETRERKDQLREVAAAAKLHGWTLRAVLGLAGLSSGLIAAMFGSVMTAVSWATGDAGGYGLSLHRYGTLLLLLTIPLLVAGAHLLDLQEAASERNSKPSARPTSRASR